MCKKNKCNCEEKVPMELGLALLMLLMFMPAGSFSKPSTTINIYTDKTVEVKNG